MIKPTILCLIAGQRAGTTALRSALGATGAFFNHGEIFHTEDCKPGAFLPFARERAIQVSDLATYERAQDVTEDYLAHLASVAGGKIPLIDVKLNSWHVLRPFWAYIHQQPFFLQALIRRRAAFVFLRREDLVEQVLSEQVARHASKWHNLTEGDLPNRITVDVLAVANQARLIVEGENFLIQFLRALDTFVAMSYEDLIVDGCVNSRLLGRLGDMYERDIPATVTPKIQKNQGD
ncbi:MAG: hypothetical protein AB8I69_14245, partial [Anaerolineae bacterium]